MKRTSIAILIAATMALPGFGASASGQTIVLGTSNARLCYEAALTDQTGRHSSLSRCESALTDEMLSRRDRVASHVNYGILLLRAGRLDEAMASLDRAIASNALLGEAWLNRGIVWLRMSEYSAAEQDFTRALSLDLSEPHKAYYSRALSYEGREMYPEAYTDYQRALELRPGWGPPLQELERYEIVRGSG